MEWFFLLAGTDFPIIIINPAVTSSLLLIVPGECFIKQFVIYVLNIFVAVFHVQTASFRVSILCMKFSAVMVDRAFSCHKADSSLQSISFLPFRAISAGFVTFAESNAKALLTAVPSIKSCLCALPRAFPSYGRAAVPAALLPP